MREELFLKKEDIRIGMYFNKSSRSIRDVIACSEFYENVEWRRPNGMGTRQCKISTFAAWSDYRVLYFVSCLKNYIVGNTTTLVEGKQYPVIAENSKGITLIDEEGNEQGFQLTDNHYVSKLLASH
jgi:hypothetical protein